jgi:hypothetical protein
MGGDRSSGFLCESFSLHQTLVATKEKKNIAEERNPPRY